jgi:hypothetical protein
MWRPDNVDLHADTVGHAIPCNRCRAPEARQAEQLVKLPDLELARKYNISTAELEQRITLILRGTSDTTGLDDARAALQEENRILAAEYIHNTVIDHVTPSFGSEDSTSISEEQLNEIDPGRIFVQDHSQGLLTCRVQASPSSALVPGPPLNRPSPVIASGTISPD